MTAPKSDPRLAGRGLGETWRGVIPRSYYTTPVLHFQRPPVIVYVRRTLTKLWPLTVRVS